MKLRKMSKKFRATWIPFIAAGVLVIGMSVAMLAMQNIKEDKMLSYATETMDSDQVEMDTMHKSTAMFAEAPKPNPALVFVDSPKPNPVAILAETSQPKSSKSLQENQQENQQESKEDLQRVDEKALLKAKVEEKLASMSLEEKIAQLFIITPEALTGTGQVTRAGETTKQNFQTYPVSGVIYFSPNLQSKEQVMAMTSKMQEFSRERIGLPVFISIDEEGGKVTRIAGRGNFGISNTALMYDIGETKDTNQAYETGKYIGSYLKEFGFNLDFAPVADVLFEDRNSVIGKRSFGKEPELVAQMVSAYTKGLMEHKVYGVLKHFPGHGGTLQDSHTEYAYENKTLDELRQTSLIPFANAKKEGIRFIMVSHISLPNVLGSNLPTSLSKTMLTDVLRNEMGFDGIIITDALAMGAIANHYTSAEAAVLAFEAGNDILLMPKDFHSAYNGLLEAVKSGRIPQSRVDESMRRILEIKLSME